MPILKKPAHVVEIVLQPGELWFGDEHTRIRTILGSCIAVTLWHPRRRIGGMCHYMLPSRIRGTTAALDGRYGDEALDILTQEIKAAHGYPHEFEAKLFGGGQMFQHAYDTTKGGRGQVSDRNIVAGRELVQRHGFVLKAEQVGGHGHRQVVFDIWSGHVWVKHAPLPNKGYCPPDECNQ
jgi:chemotaxis protein CheD